MLDVLEFYTENQKREREEYNEHGILGPIPGINNNPDDRWADLVPKNTGQPYYGGPNNGYDTQQMGYSGNGMPMDPRDPRSYNQMNAPTNRMDAADPRRYYDGGVSVLHVMRNIYLYFFPSY